MKNRVMNLVNTICDLKSADCRSLNKSDIARELMNLANIPESAKIQEIPLDWNSQVEILFTLPDDTNYYSLFAGIGRDGNFYFQLSITGFLDGEYFEFYDNEKKIDIDYFVKNQNDSMVADQLYTCYETNQTMNQKNWFLFYLQSDEINKTEYPDFITWWADMRKSGVIEEV